MVSNNLDESTYSFGIETLQSWRLALERRGVTDKRLREFPFKEVLKLYHKYGKLGVDARLLEELVQTQNFIHQHASGSDSFIYRFLNTLCDILLDQHYKTFNYNTYTGVPIFELIQTYLAEYEPDDFAKCLEVQSSLIIAILCEMLCFEIQALHQMDTAPSSKKIMIPKLKQRILLALCALKEFRMLTNRVLLPSSLDDLIGSWRDEVQSPLTCSPLLGEQALQMVEEILLQTGSEVRLSLKMSVFPISFSHDENMFIRLTQLFERFFNIIATGLQASVHASYAYRFDEAAGIIQKITEIFKLSSSITSIFSTLPEEHFAFIRLITEKANATESKQLKRIIKLSTFSTRDEDKSFLTMHDIFNRLLQDPIILGHPSFIVLVENMRMLDETYRKWKKANEQMTTMLMGKLNKSYFEHTMFPFLARKASQMYP
jgi:tryptophan 2,3-dioxygenase